MPTPKLRLVKVFVQPVFVLDDGDTITEIEHPSVSIPASEWPTYSSERFPAEVKRWQRDLDIEAKPSRPKPASKPKPANRPKR